MTKTKRKRFGDLEPMYKFELNPYPDLRFNRCLHCDNKTGQRKLPLLVHVDSMNLIALNYTCRYCRHCDLLIAHKHKIEHLLTTMFAQSDPSVIGNDYLVFGTVEKKAWRDNITQPKTPTEMMPHIHDFKDSKEIRVTQAGWFRADREPPVRIPPPSMEWVKPGTKH